MSTLYGTLSLICVAMSLYYELSLHDTLEANKYLLWAILTLLLYISSRIEEIKNE